MLDISEGGYLPSLSLLTVSVGELTPDRAAFPMQVTLKGQACLHPSPGLSFLVLVCSLVTQDKLIPSPFFKHLKLTLLPPLGLSRK